MPPKTIVQKFGGSSLGSQELREIAASRVVETKMRGYMPVVVCSALGRAPDAYATDTLANLMGPAKGGPNRDLLLACGETIACALFAELLSSWGAPAQAMTGGQAGILTDESYGDAKVLSVDPTNVNEFLASGIIPVITGFQGVTVRGATTTLGRGGSDLSAVVMGKALGSESVEIFTDVSGVMTGDPRRIAGAQAIDRMNWVEMTELAGHGAKVMHSKGADLARVSNTSYVIKGLRSNVGTIIDDGTAPDRNKPVTGITSQRELAFLRIIQGEIDDPQERIALELQIFQRLAENDVSIDMINVNTAGVFFIVFQHNLDIVRRELADLNLAVRVRTHCAALSIVGAGMRGTPGVMYRVVAALSGAGVPIIHSTDSNITISLLVDEEDATRAEQAIHDYFKLGRATAEVPS